MTDGPDFVASFMNDYFAECEEHLAAVRRNLLLLESAIDRPDPPRGVVEELFRSFHSLKGISAMVELRAAERLAHEMETYLGAVRDRRLVLQTAGFEALIEATTRLEQVIAARRTDSEIPPVDGHIGRLIEERNAASHVGADAAGEAGRSDAAPDGGLWTVTFTPSPELVGRGVKVDTIRGRLAQIGRIVSVIPRVSTGAGVSFEFRVADVDERILESWRDDGVTWERVERPSDPAADVALPAGSAARSPRASDAALAISNVVRVDLARLDDLMRLVGNLVVARARLEGTLGRVERFMPASEWRRLQEDAEGIERQLRDLREAVMRVRLVPVGEIFRRMPFVVRDLARDGGKRVRLELVGQNAEIDKFLIERMMDPVLHLVRNAVSHGIEGPDERIAAGKPPDGTIRLAASTVGETVAIEVSDDGRGMDVAAIARRARQMGLPTPETGLDDRALLDVICAAGFSTRAEADRASGRGVGMAVVRDAVQELGGTLGIETAAGTGTTFRATLPLTLAITDALIVHVGDHTFAVPQSAVREVAEVAAGAIRAIENNELVTHRGQSLAVARLSRLFGIAAPPRTRMHMIVVGTGLAAVGLLVDRISGQREIVVKSLRDPLVAVAGVAGATELGDGRLVLILDVGGLTRKLGMRAAPVRAAV